MNIKPKVSIIIATYNSSKTLEKTLISILEQNFKSKELIIIDGGSNDGTQKIINKYRNEIYYYSSERDTGIYNAWNKGVIVANGEWICFVGDDDYLLNNDGLEKLFFFTNQLYTSKIKLVYCNLILIKDDIYYSQIGSDWEITKSKLKITMSLPHVGLLHHYSLFKEFGLFNEKYKIAGDYEFMLRVTKKYNALYLQNLSVFGMTIGGVSTQKKLYLNLIKEEYSARKDNNIPPINILLIKRLMYWYLRNFFLMFGEGFFSRIKSIYNDFKI